MINNRGTSALETLPIPSSRFLCEINHNINHPARIDIAIIGTIVAIPLTDSVDCKKVFVK